jgi:hypothetical protein
MIATVELSDGKPCQIRVLGIFDLDGVGSEMLGPYTYRYQLVTGEEVEDVYPLENITRPPEMPDVGDDTPVPGTQSWWRLAEWQTYKAAVGHERRRLDSVHDRLQSISRFIVDHCLVNPDDRAHIVDRADWAAVYEAALVPQLSMAHVARALKDTYAARFDGMDVLEALATVSGGLSEYAAIRMWENELMIAMRLGESEYALMPLMERARKIGALKAKDWFGILESERQRAEMEARRE